jgi:hypothetical protein
MITVGLLFWLLYIIGLVFHGYRDRLAIVDSLFWWVLIFLLGVGVFGFPIK